MMNNLLIEQLEAKQMLSVTLLDRETKAIVSQYYKDKNLSRNEIIGILRQTTDQNIININEIKDLRNIVNNYRMPDHVRNLAKDVVFGSLANSHFQGKPLGNLLVNSSANRMNNLVDKWFYGKDRPTVDLSLIEYKKINAPLFVNGATSSDIAQGSLGNCYLFASLAAVADKLNAQTMFIDNLDRTWTVRFYRLEAGISIADYVTVDDYLPVWKSDGSPVFAKFGNNFNDPSNELWVGLAEKAYAQWNETGFAFNLNRVNSYSAIGNGGWPHICLAQITGVNTKFNFISSPEAKSLLTSSVIKGDAVVITKYFDSSRTIAHAYFVKSYSNGTFALFNPWGFDHLKLTFDEIKSSSYGFAIVSRK